ncbi:hypothetical protein AYO20_02329 [Fonsecaea nubica]|uniref:4a-hydroxytetrahydrobiopterin dehydratase n=1 Tax=Fonsecaea nubica TaxID=856822 RepID=A0A178D7R1_9EURO|nr:hypothetical protein AYO20_02329 [Fonsecaea nubica]OAL38270.1 hypothetical protein AYO20_02329 [Fonsecaea nubica]
MRLASRVGNYVVQSHATASAYRNVNELRLQCQRTPQLRPSMYSSHPQRCLSLSSSDPIAISDDRQTITFRLNNGGTVSQKLLPTPKANRDKLADALASLLSTSETSRPDDLLLKRSSGLSFGTTQWQLDALGDAIHRHTAHPSVGECDEAERLIMVEAEKMNHHPHISRGNFGGENRYMTITCTTHSPRGLSVRDTRLAHKIDAILDEFSVTEPVSPDGVQDSHEIEKQLVHHREQMIALNRQQISEALESCSCGTAKAKPAATAGESS